MNSNPGLYQEKLDTIHLKREDWQIVIYVNVTKFLATHGTVASHETVYTNCTLRVDSSKCRHVLSLDLLELKNKRLEHIQYRIKDMIREFEETLSVSRDNPKNFRTKRMAPLGVIGSMSKGLFGLVTTDDVDLINKNIDQLFSDQKDMVKLIQDRSHIIAANMEELYNVTQKHQEALSKIESYLREKIVTFMKEGNEIKYFVELDTYVRRTEAKIEHHIEVSQTFLDILKRAIEKKIHPNLISPKIIKEIAHHLI